MSENSQSEFGRSVLLGTVLLLSIGCSTDLNERLLPCPDSTVLGSARAVGPYIFLRPAADHDWFNLLREPWRAYGYPPITIQEMERRYGSPARRWEAGGRPFVEFTLTEGRLQLGLEEDRSGSTAYRAWRLRWKPKRTELVEILEDSVFQCVADLLRPDVDLMLSGHETRVFMRVRENEVHEIIWTNLDNPPSGYD